VNGRSILALVLALGAGQADGRDADARTVERASLTFYWIVDESSSRYDGSRTAELLDVRGRVIARTHPRFRRELLMEGTGRLRDGRVVAFHKKLRGVYRFRISRSQFGRSSLGCSLVPYRTVAVDPAVVPLGSKLFIPQLQGAKLPDGSTHDGVFLATDRGQFRGAQVDVFVGAGAAAAKPFTRRGYRSRSRVTLHVQGKMRSRCSR
jgi:3D (Asp-Asp-Asp) domain-containing protein